jgi:hypothetical protein
MPHRSHRVNDMPRGKPVTVGDLGIAGGTAAEGAAFGQQLRPRGAMDCAIDPSSAEQRFIGSVDDRIKAKSGDVRCEDFQPSRADFARPDQAEAGAAVTTPLSASNCCSSPAWNISRMISQPPTNSPFT